MHANYELRHCLSKMNQNILLLSDSLKKHFMYWFWKNISDTLTFIEEIIYFNGKSTISITINIIYSHRNK